MKLNCKPGDLAVIVRSTCGNEGKIVRCIELHPAGTDNSPIFKGPIWEIDAPIPSTWGDQTPYCPDSQLRPLRDNQGADETLTWLDVPTKETA